MILKTKERELLQRIVDYMWEGELVDEIKELLAQPEQTEQEPVAWMQDDIELYVLEEKDIVRGYVIPLYTAPPKQEPLSDEEIAILWGDKYSGKTFMVRNFARAIEKAHGIGGVE